MRRRPGSSPAFKPRPAEAAGWYVLIHQLPPTPLYLRAKIRNRLARVGAVAIKNSVYVLPANEECLEDFQWIVQESVAGGGDAFVCQGQFLAGVSTASLVARFRRDADERYEPLQTEVTGALAHLRSSRRGARESASDPAALTKLRSRFEALRAVDFFDSDRGREIAAMMRVLDQPKPTSKTSTTARFRDLLGRTWVTRRNPKVDRLSSAWLIRRFIDPAARFRFIDVASEARRAGELGFDFVGAEYSHDGDRCTFETLVHRLGIKDAAVRHIGEIVHDLDVKDGKFGRPEAPGVMQLIAGLVRGYADDDGRLVRGVQFFEDLYISLGGAPRAATGKRRSRSKGNQ